VPITKYLNKNGVNSKQQKTLMAVFEVPIRANIVWKDIESLLIALGGETSEGKGSRVRVYLNERRASFHRPHQRKEADKGTVKSVRGFLENAGVSVGE